MPKRSVGLGIGVDVELDHADLAGTAGRDLLQGRRQGVARAAPVGEEVDQHRALGGQHIAGETRVGDLFDGLWT